MTQIKVEIDNRKVLKALANLQDATVNLEPAMASIGEYYVRKVDQRFVQEGPGWKPLSPKYAAWKARQPRAIQKTLQFSGLLRASINYQASETEVRIGSDKIYSARQEKERPFLKPDKQDESEFAAIVLDYLGERSE
jgi:phage gpG-like protein